MIPLVDIHCHLLAALDDGPGSADEAVTMCRMAWDEGIRMIAATAHLSEQWPEVTPGRIRGAAGRLASCLTEAQLPMTIRPSAEIAIRPNLEEAWAAGQLLGVADRKAYVMLELPAGSFVDLRDTVRRFARLGSRPILAHPERHAELLHDDGAVEDLVRLGCLMQVSSESVTNPACREDGRHLKRWIQRGIIHLIGSDGHSPRSRPPRMARAYRRIAHWAGTGAANRICSTNGLAVLEGFPLQLPEPKPRRRRWLSRLR